jgi:ribonuclease T1
MFNVRLFLIVALALPILSISYAPVRADREAGRAVLAYSVGKTQGHSAGLPTVSVSDLPSEARDALALIKKGGPFPYPRDGIFFGNREGRLPAQPRGYYKEFTVKTPGSRDRGARRIVSGSGGEFYYTDDHYKTFRLIKE